MAVGSTRTGVLVAGSGVWVLALSVREAKVVRGALEVWAVLGGVPAAGP